MEGVIPVFDEMPKWVVAALNDDVLPLFSVNKKTKERTLNLGLSYSLYRKTKAKD